MTSQCEWQPIETLLQKDGLVLLLFYGGIIRIGRKSEGLFVCSLNIANTDVHVTCMGNDLPTGWKQLPDIPVDELSLIANKKAMEAAAESDDWNAAYINELNKLGFRIVAESDYHGPRARFMTGIMACSPSPTGTQYPWPSFIVPNEEADGRRKAT